jgi:nitrate reductase alpha subunit
MDVLASATAMGWMPFYPQFDRSSLDLADEARARAARFPYVAEQLARVLKLAVTDPDNPRNWPRVLNIWRANLLGSSSKGNEYFLRTCSAPLQRAGQPTPEALRPNDIAWHDDIPEGKLDLLMSVDFRMTSTTLLSDVVLPAALVREGGPVQHRHASLHPRVQPGHRPAVGDPVGLRCLRRHRRGVQHARRGHLGTRTDVVLGTLQHDTPGAMAYPVGPT